MTSWVYCLPTDIIGEGAAPVLANLAHRAGTDGAVVAAKYHASRDVYPHNPRWKVATLAPGVFYRPVPGSGNVAIAPVASPTAEGRDVLGEVMNVAHEIGIKVSAWAVVLHDDTIGPDHPAVQVNCWGDGSAGVLCPAHPDARAYALSVVADLVGYGVDSLRLESAHYHGIRHGHHHERFLEDHGSVALWLLGLCFCSHCRAAAEEQGVAVERLQSTVRRWLAESFEHAPPKLPLSLASLGHLFGDEVVRYVKVRQDVVSSLVATAVELARGAGVPVTFVDTTLATAGRDPGAEDTGLAADRGWVNGIDIRGLASCEAQVEVTGYVASLSRLVAEVAAYRSALPVPSRLSVVLRPGLPDSATLYDLVDKLVAVRRAGADEIAFYNYGIYRLSALDRIREAMEGGTWSHE